MLRGSDPTTEPGTGHAKLSNTKNIHQSRLAQRDPKNMGQEQGEEQVKDEDA